MRSEAASKAYSKHAYAIMFCDVSPLIQGFQSGIDSPSLGDVESARADSVLFSRTG